jgi:hypothetical protein
VLRARKAVELKDVLVESRRTLRKKDAAVLEPVRAGMQAHGLVGAGRGLVFNDRVGALVCRP